MHPSIVTIIACAVLCEQFVQARECAAPPLNLPLRTVSIAPGTLSHGIQISIGTPPQQLVLKPSLQLDTPFIPRYTNTCIYAADASIPANDTRWNGQDGKTACAEIYGGGFTPSLSTTFFDNGTNSPVSEAWFKQSRFSDWHFVTDEFKFQDYVEVFVQQNKALPEKRKINTSFILPDEGKTFGGLGSSALSLTPSSRLLETLLTERMIASKSWSLSNETLCLGCVDQNTFTGEFQKFKSADRKKDGGLPCLLQVKVETLDFHADAGSEGVALLENAFYACIDPGVPFVALPTDVRAKLSGAANADVQAAVGQLTNLASISSNSSSFFRFKLEGALEVDVAIQIDGLDDDESRTLQMPPLGPEHWGAYGEAVPVLGKPFTNLIVLRWDEAAQEYGLARRIFRMDRKSDLKPLGCDTFPSLSDPVETTPSVGVIVGSIIGGFVAGLFFAMAAVFFYRRGQTGVQSKYEAMHDEDAVSLRTIDTGGLTLQSKISGVLSTSAPSLRESMRSHFSTRSVSPVMEPHLVSDSQVFEAPEGGTRISSGRERVEYSGYDRY